MDFSSYNGNMNIISKQLVGPCSFGSSIWTSSKNTNHNNIVLVKVGLSSKFLWKISFFKMPIYIYIYKQTSLKKGSDSFKNPIMVKKVWRDTRWKVF
jgi:hypothetical protein